MLYHALAEKMNSFGSALALQTSVIVQVAIINTAFAISFLRSTLPFDNKRLFCRHVGILFGVQKLAEQRWDSMHGRAFNSVPSLI